MSAKILINGAAGQGKTELLRTLENAFVVSRDGKTFPFKIAHMTVTGYISMDALINGITIKDADGVEEYHEGIMDKLEKYNEKFGEYPATIVFDSVSKIFLDVIEYATDNIPKEWGQQGAFVNKELGILNNFIQETLVANGMSVVLINHVMKDEEKGFVPSVAQGKFSNKGGFYSEVDHSILIHEMKVHHRSTKNQARTTLNDLPDFQYVANTVKPEKSRKLKDDEEYYDLQEHINKILAIAAENAEWSF